MNSFKFKSALLIDDNQIDNLINKKILENNLFAEKIVVAGSAEVALNYLKNESPENTPDVIFLDIRMPEIDGFQFLDEFAKLDSTATNHPKIFMLSSSLDPKDQTKVRESKYVDKFLGKPLSNQHLLELDLRID